MNQNLWQHQMTDYHNSLVPEQQIHVHTLIIHMEYKGIG